MSSDGVWKCSDPTCSVCSHRKFTLGQRFGIRVIAWVLRLRPDAAPELRAVLDQGYRRRPEYVRTAMWQAALEWNGVRVG